MTQLLEDLPREDLRLNLEKIHIVLEQNRFQNEKTAKLICVTKTVAPSIINMLREFGETEIAENRAQVALPKIPYLDPGFHLHWIGQLQTNKVRSIISNVTLLHSLDRINLAQEVEKRAGEAGRVVQALVQVNIAHETQKAGMAPEEVRGFLRLVGGFSNLRVIGLMSIMPAGLAEAELSLLFRGMRTLFDQLREESLPGIEMRELSMGMSGDYPIAAREGATMVRIGTALFSKKQSSTGGSKL